MPIPTNVLDDIMDLDFTSKQRKELSERFTLIRELEDEYTADILARYDPSTYVVARRTEDSITGKVIRSGVIHMPENLKSQFIPQQSNVPKKSKVKSEPADEPTDQSRPKKQDFIVMPVKSKITSWSIDSNKDQITINRENGSSVTLSGWYSILELP